MISKTLRAAAIVMGIMMIIGTLGFHTIEKWSWVESFYATAMTITGTGAEGYVPRSDGGKIFTSILAIFSVGVIIGIIAMIFHPIANRVLEITKSELK